MEHKEKKKEREKNPSQTRQIKKRERALGKRKRKKRKKGFQKEKVEGLKLGRVRRFSGKKSSITLTRSIEGFSVCMKKWGAVVSDLEGG